MSAERAEAAPRQQAAAPTAGAPLVSVVVPVLNEADALPGLLDHLAALPGRLETVIVDGGSTDRTVAVARAHPLRPRVVQSKGGRGAQLNAGPAAARGDVLLFLHADSRLPATAWAAVTAAMVDPGLGGGNFAVRFDGGDGFSRILATLRRLQRRAGIYYGDSAIFCRRGVFEALGGYAPLPVMEDYDFARRMERGFPTVCLPDGVTTSARRWKRLGLWRTLASWAAIRWLFLAGVPAERLARLYRHAR